ncbi:MAG: signal peptidase II [Fidelibacterota bacterium]
MRVLIYSAVALVLDQLTKLAAKNFMEPGQSIAILGNTFRLTYIQNPGMAFGINIGGVLFFTIVSLLASCVIFIYLLKSKSENFYYRFSLALILGGAIGNLFDRLLYGKVVDFLDFGIGNLRWPVFNLADTAVTIGMFIFFASAIFEKKGKLKS